MYYVVIYPMDSDPPFEQLGPGSRKKHGRWRVSDPIDLPSLRRLHVNAAEGLSEMTLNVIKS